MDKYAARRIKRLEREVRHWQIPAQAMALMLNALVAAGLVKKMPSRHSCLPFKDSADSLTTCSGPRRLPAELRERLDGAARRMLAWLGSSAPRPGRVQLNLTEEELGAAADLVQNYPWMGGKKGAGNLVHNGKAWVEPSSYDHIKQTIVAMT